jgi:type IV secretion system protein VirB10
MARMKPAEAPKRRRGVNPYALSAVTAVAGVGVGAWLVLAAPEAPAPAPALETASVSDFQGAGLAPTGFRSRKKSRRSSLPPGHF